MTSCHHDVLLLSCDIEGVSFHNISVSTWYLNSLLSCRSNTYFVSLRCRSGPIVVSWYFHSAPFQYRQFAVSFRYRIVALSILPCCSIVALPFQPFQYRRFVVSFRYCTIAWSYSHIAIVPHHCIAEPSLCHVALTYRRSVISQRCRLVYLRTVVSWRWSLDRGIVSLLCRRSKWNTSICLRYTSAKI